MINNVPNNNQTTKKNSSFELKPREEKTKESVFGSFPSASQPLPPVAQKQRPAPEAISTSGGIVTMQDPKAAMLKLAYIAIFITAFITGAIFITKQIYASKRRETLGVLLQTPYQPVTWKDFGNVFEPQLKIPVVYPNQGVQKITFLLDSGALISSMPREEAEKLGYDSLAKLQRSTFMGFGGKVSFAYRGEMQAVLGEEKVNIPVVFTEAGGTKFLLGRLGFFEKYSIYFNSKDQQIEVRKI